MPLPDIDHYPLQANPLDTLQQEWSKVAVRTFWRGQQPVVRDWTDYRQRMALITALFRGYQHHSGVVGFAGLSCSHPFTEGPKLDAASHSPMFEPRGLEELARYRPAAPNWFAEVRSIQ